MRAIYISGLGTAVYFACCIGALIAYQFGSVRDALGFAVMGLCWAWAPAAFFDDEERSA
jgi:fucose permease